LRNCNAKGVGSSAPTILSLSVPADDNYLEDENLDFTATFSEAVNVVGTPRIAITMDSGVVYANYVSGSGTAAILFRHVVTDTDLEATGIDIATPIDLNGGSIKDLGGQNAVVSFTDPDLTGVLVNDT